MTSIKGDGEDNIVKVVGAGQGRGCLSNLKGKMRIGELKRQIKEQGRMTVCIEEQGGSGGCEYSKSERKNRVFFLSFTKAKSSSRSRFVPHFRNNENKPISISIYTVFS
jgi:hypothetical protein